MKSCVGGSLHVLVEVVVRRSWGGPDEFLSKRSLRALVLVRRSCGDPVQIPLKVFALRSRRCSAVEVLVT